MFLVNMMHTRKPKPQISCAGATDSITFNVMISKSDGDTGWLRIGEIGGQSVEIQGYSINDVQSGFDNLANDTDYPVFMQDIEIVAITNPQEDLFADVAQVTVKNATVGNKRLYIEAYRGYIDFTYVPEYADEPVLSTDLDVGAVYADPLNTSMSSKFEFCLAPRLENGILIGNYTDFGEYRENYSQFIVDITVNGVSYLGVNFAPYGVDNAELATLFHCYSDSSGNLYIDAIADVGVLDCVITNFIKADQAVSSVSDNVTQTATSLKFKIRG